MNKKLMTTLTNSGVLKCISMPNDDQIFHNHWHHSFEQRHYSFLTCSKPYIHIIQVDYYHRFEWIEVEAWYHSQIIGNMVKMTQESMLTKPITKLTMVITNSNISYGPSKAHTYTIFISPFIKFVQLQCFFHFMVL